MSSTKTAFVVGASGAVGRRLVDVLVASKQFSRVVLLGRRTLDDIPADGVVEQKIVDFDNIEKHSEDFSNIDVGFCALGTTRGKSGADGFYKVDHDYVVNTAKVAKKQGVTEFIMVSSAGADENSFFLYPKTKGAVEREVADMGFKKTLIVRPAFLEGPREEFRLGECVAKIFVAPLKLFSGKIAISTEDVAKAMVVGALSRDIEGKVIWDNVQLQKVAKEFEPASDSSRSHMSSTKTAFVVGASGAVGRRLVDVLVASKQFSRVVLLGRRTLDDIPADGVVEQKIVDFDNIEKHSEDFSNIDVGFCALGTTRGKSGADGFYKVDHDYVVNTAKVAKNQGVEEFVLVSSGGADEKSLFLYLKTKGEVEREVSELGFKKTLIVRPGVLEGPREDLRLAERLAKIFVAPLKLFSNKFVISTEEVAKAMVIGALSRDIEGKVIWDSAHLKRAAKEFEPASDSSRSQ